MLDKSNLIWKDVSSPLSVFGERKQIFSHFAFIHNNGIITEAF